ncbi:extracellular solute-binding protein [Bosea sp. BK604]|uniref:extracellular solute-binding protein n=1 Tax=Bosea sp. BK604 TaxID=2512180 RepID=UPI001048FB90|nr:extracellular solute-binding protein [Bosea sp. BK604]TCR64596.1 putative spermidine/putrescine transport system substrate-binding protein [Bosea sp. BK604]
MRFRDFRNIVCASAAAASLAFAAPGAAVEGIGGKPVNVKSSLDFGKLTAANFYDTLVPLAKQEGTVTFFDFSNSFEKLFREELIPGFERKYGIKVNYQRGNAEAAAQQLVATSAADQPAPFDLLYNASSSLGVLMRGSAVANVPFHKLLPNAAAYDERIATTAEGIVHGGLFAPFHRNQTALAVNSRFVRPGTEPGDFPALLAWAKANPKRLAVTNPGKGGSGDGFLQSLVLAMVTGDDCRKALDNFTIGTEEAKAYVASPCMAPVWSYYRDLLAVSEITNSNADTLNLITNAEAWIGTAWEDMTYDFTGRGLLPPTVRPMLLKEGQVGGGDGFFLPVRPRNPAAALLLMDFLMSKEVQLTKLRMNGSRAARTDIDTDKEFSEAQAKRLIPAEQYPSRARTGIPRAITLAAAAYFQENLLRGR